MMTNVQLYLSIGLPTFMVLLGVLLNLASTRDLRCEMMGRFDRLESWTSAVESTLHRMDDHLITFYTVTGKLEGRMDSMEKQR